MQQVRRSRCRSLGGFTSAQRQFERATEVVVYKYKVGGSLCAVALSRKELLIRYYTQVQ
jgi:hypothetical protein